MNNLLELLSGGNLQSDGRANDAADEVLRCPELLPQLVEGLADPNDVIRGRTAHALERIGRSAPHMLAPLLPRLYHLGLSDPVPMVRWHVAMILGNSGVTGGQADEALAALLQLLDDGSVFVKSWAIVSLTVLGRDHPPYRPQIIERFSRLRDDPSIAIRSKIRKALDVLVNEKIPIPGGWIKAREKIFK